MDFAVRRIGKLHTSQRPQWINSSVKFFSDTLPGIKERRPRLAFWEEDQRVEAGAAGNQHHHYAFAVAMVSEVGDPRSVSLREVLRVEPYGQLIEGGEE